MKQFFSAAAILFFTVLVSCDSKPENKEQIAAPSVLPATTNPVLPGGYDSLAASNQGVALNPQHGEPGHRCDIAVGAPLNAPATTSTIQPNAPTSAPGVITPAATTDAKTVTPKSTPATATLNPKHGEPGHRCDIAVGAPLSGKPQ
ncbi:MAG TPA: hypothetical protein VFT15_13430 [Chitinophagaceae bacterium]|nr:hypothetical protein [Chitinophagaceae bacterium]